MVSSTPYWWEEAPPASPPQVAVQAKCDVVIVGAGYTGLSAGLTLARAGRRSRSSTGSVPARGPRRATAASPAATCGPATGRWSRKFGEARANAIQAEAKAAREDLAEFIARESDRLRVPR